MTTGERDPAPAPPAGFAIGGARGGIKEAPGALDVAVIAAPAGCVAAGVYTTSAVVAAPVTWCRARTPGAVRAVAINSGNANACTGAAGEADCAATAARVAARLGLPSADAVLVLSTGVIGVPLPMEALGRGIDAATATLGGEPADLERGARAMMTTDSRPKWASATIPGTAARVVGVAKGAAMIAPNMATMLAVVMTDAEVEPAAAQGLLAEVVRGTFNRITVDGHASTNDTVLLLAGGEAGPVAPAALREAVEAVCATLARAIPADGEGATKLVEVVVRGAADADDAERHARAIAESPLVKTAIFGRDPNWGRIVSAAGASGAALDPARTSLHLQETLVYRAGTPQPFDEAALSARMEAEPIVAIRLELGLGDAEARFWTCDLTDEYVRLNADYRT